MSQLDLDILCLTRTKMEGGTEVQVDVRGKGLGESIT